MRRVEGHLDVESSAALEGTKTPALWPPLVVALSLVILVAAAIVAASPSAWVLLGAGRGLVPAAYYPLSGYVLILATALGHAVAWAGASLLVYHVLTLVGFAAAWSTARVAMTLTYVGLAGLPLAAFHLLYGGWLLGLPRTGLEAWLLENHPDAHWILIAAHPVVDFSLAPLGVGFLALLWGFGDRLRRQAGLQTAWWLCLLGTSLAVALSLAIHSALVHVRL
ncbi:MAG: hypothetical protein ACREMB_12105 [Candidatus Rokuibacteriota bacterium]